MRAAARRAERQARRSERELERRLQELERRTAIYQAIETRGRMRSFRHRMDFRKTRGFAVVEPLCWHDLRAASRRLDPIVH